MERERQEQLLKQERKKRRQLLSDSLGWRKAGEIRAFVAAVNARNNQELEGKTKTQLDHWSAWALAEADRLDPLSRPCDDITAYLCA